MEPEPILSLCLALAWESTIIIGTILMLVRARTGYFVAGMGFLLNAHLVLLDSATSQWYPPHTLNAAVAGLLLFGIPAWLLHVCVADEPFDADEPGDDGIVWDWENY